MAAVSSALDAPLIPRQPWRAQGDSGSRQVHSVCLCCPCSEQACHATAHPPFTMQSPGSFSQGEEGVWTPPWISSSLSVI